MKCIFLEAWNRTWIGSRFWSEVWGVAQSAVTSEDRTGQKRNTAGGDVLHF